MTFDYYLAKASDTLSLKLEVLENNKVIRTFTNKKPKGFKSWPGGPSSPQVLPSKKGYNRFTWNFSREAIPSIDKVFVFGGHDGSSVGPGIYILRLSLDNEVSETIATVLANPSVKANAQDFTEQQSMLVTIENTLKEMHESVNSMRSAKSQLKGYAKLLDDNELTKALLEKGKALTKRIDTWERHLIQPDQKTFQDVINFNNKLNAQLIHLKGYLDVADPKVTEGAKERLQDLLADWDVYKTERNAITNTEMSAYNKMFKALELPAIILKE